MKNRYKVETLFYQYDWIDVGPGPSVRGNITGMRPILRDYRKTFYTLETAVEELVKFQKVFPENVTIISKFVNKEYIPGKIIISMRGTPSWELVDKYYTYRWKRNNTKLPFFCLMINDEPCTPTQKQFFKKELTFAEIINSNTMFKAFTSENMLSFLNNPLFMSKRYLLKSRKKT